MASFSAGLGLVGGVKRGKQLPSEDREDFWSLKRHYEDKQFTTAGIPLQFQLFCTPSRVFGFGLIGFGNINKERSYYGGMLCIQLGKLR